MPERIRPVQKLAEAVAKCSVEAAEYGKCICADYNNVYQNKCAASFEKLRACVMSQKKK
ncbi:hypothetical protein EX30DRAFT_339357 [Ascodesmis nigricans]|uniref:Uncharacterized protein n=1 Tax=Ascodesmis nigricans TaxID=341454 RepID=A0A4V6RHH0_9PEZI|nr:hypothetical protein EX30DRAFT_339357 [Ascodesmis nigricans]